MEMNFETIVDICFKERDEGNKLISVSIVVKDGNSGEIRVYNSDEYGISKYNNDLVIKNKSSIELRGKFILFGI